MGIFDDGGHRMSTGPTKAERDAIVERDQYTCQRCYRSLPGEVYSIHHRVPRGRGGDNRMSNMVSLCGSGTTGCHGWIESNRIAATDLGWLISTSAAGIPGVLAAESIGLIRCDGTVFQLTDSGERVEL